MEINNKENNKKTIKITKISLEETQRNTEHFNSNNHHSLAITYGRLLSEEDYNFFKAKSARHTWAHLQSSSGVLEHTFTKNDLLSLRDASSLGILTGRRPEMELDSIQERLPAIEKEKEKDGKEEKEENIKRQRYFIRLSECSPKDGVKGCGPFDCRSDVLDSLISSERCLKTYKHDKSAVLYFVPWRDDWHQEHAVEFRVFCYHGKTTTITQYNWAKDVGIKSIINGDKTILIKVSEDIIKFCEEEIIPKLSNDTEGNWTIDVIYNFNNKTAELVEVNSFGCELAAGSGLFHWVRDMDVMYGKTDYVEFRYVTDE